MKTLLAINTVTILLLTLNMWHDGKRIDRLQREQKDLRQQFVRAAGMMGEIAFLSHRHHDKAWMIHTNDLRPQLWTNTTIYITNKTRPISIPEMTNDPYWQKKIEDAVKVLPSDPQR